MPHRFPLLRIAPPFTIACIALLASSQGWTQVPSAAVQRSMQTPAISGEAVYERACASCHNNPEATKSPALDTLRRMRYQQISYALTQGKMQTQAAALSPTERTALIEYLVGREATSDDWIASFVCAPDRRAVDLRANATIAGFGFDKENHRHLTRAQAGLATTDFANLELAWAIGFPGATTMRSQPAIVGSTMFLPVADASRMFAIDIAGTPCLKWVYQNEEPLRTSAGFGEIKGGRKVLVMSDLASNVHLVDAKTGERIWKQHVGLYQFGLTTGTPVIHEDRVYAPISQYEITVGGNNDHECCKTHGAVTALDAATGKKIWTAHTMEEAKPVRDRGDGKMLWGPSGAPIWNSPAIDIKRGQLYVGTGEATSEPAHKNTDAIMAIALKDGAVRWSHQATENDIFLSGCGRNRPGLNCPKDSVFRDVDFGASMILARGTKAGDLVLGGQKSGTLWAMNADNGSVVWRQDFGTGSPLGGIHWGIAFDGERVFAPINRPYGAPTQNPTQKPGMHAVNVNTGEVLWTFTAEPDCTGDRQSRVRNCSNNIGLSAAPTVIDGAVVAGGLDGFLRAFDAKTGAVLFKFDTAQSFDTANDVPANGGAIDSASIVAANGYLFVTSGYGMFGQPPGNVLLAFKAKPAQKSAGN